jgi:hypothetical protein
MTRDQVKEILDRVMNWPLRRQADLVHIIDLMEEQDRCDLQLTDEEVAEVRRRLADPKSTLLTLEQVRERFAKRPR